MPDLLVSSGKSKVTEKQYLDRTCYHWQCFNKIFEFTFFLSHGSNTRDAVTLISKGWQFALGIVAAILMTACQWQQLYKASFPIIFLWSFAVFFSFSQPVSGNGIRCIWETETLWECMQLKYAVSHYINFYFFMQIGL